MCFFFFSSLESERVYGFVGDERWGGFAACVITVKGVQRQTKRNRKKLGSGAVGVPFAKREKEKERERHLKKK